MKYQLGSKDKRPTVSCRRAAVVVRSTWLLVVAAAHAGPVGFAGQASGWATAGYDTSLAGKAGLRYIPSLSAGIGPLDGEAAVNGLASIAVRSTDSITAEARAKPYRLWVRLSSARFEARAGLQKINFGSATLLRPLQWFDRIDPRDPLKLTDGVYGALARYYFQNNANLWAWGLWGNKNPKGMEVHGTLERTPEFGGRVQVPMPRGEIAAAYHHRRVDFESVFPEVLTEQDEDRLGLDARADVGPGLWFEGVISRQTQRMIDGTDSPAWQRAATVGADYTFGLGNGLLVTAEHLVLDTGRGSDPYSIRVGPLHVSAALASYPLGLVDHLHGIAFVDWQSRALYRFLAWQRTLDNWIINLAAFWNPDSPVSGLGTRSDFPERKSVMSPSDGVAGKGVQLTVVYNH